MRRLHRRPVAWLSFGILGIALLALGGLSRVAGAQGAPAFTGIKALATSDGVSGTFGDPSKQPYPTAAGQMAHTEATLSSGPTGYALASVAWPGPLVANAGSLAVLLGAPSGAGQANYSGRAEAFSPVGPNDAELGPGMRAHALGDVAEATAAAQNVVTSPGFSTGNVATTSRGAIEAGRLVAFSQSLTSDIGLGGDVVHIDSVQTVAQASTDGETSEAGGFTVVNGLTVNGQDATVDEEGVRFSDPAVGPLNEQLLANLGIDMFVSKPQSSNSGNAASYTSGSLVVVWDFFDSGQFIVYTIGGSVAKVQGVRGTALAAPTTTPPTTRPATGSPAVTAAPVTTARPATPAPAPAPAPVEAAAPPAALPTTPVGFVRELGPWPYILGALFTAAAAWGLRRVREGVFDRPPDVTCPNAR